MMATTDASVWSVGAVPLMECGKEVDLLWYQAMMKRQRETDRQTEGKREREREREEHNKGLEADVLQEMYNLDRAALL